MKRQQTIGYAVADQAPNGLIHLIGTRTQSNQHWELNEAWILSDAEETDTDQDPSIYDIQVQQSTYPNGRLRARWSGCITSQGEYRLHGPQVHFFEDGKPQYRVFYSVGTKVGQETLWDREGRKRWNWEHHADGTSVWTQYWASGKLKARSSWQAFRAHGPAQRWDETGKLVSDVRFLNGQLQD